MLVRRWARSPPHQDRTQPGEGARTWILRNLWSWRQSAAPSLRLRQLTSRPYSSEPPQPHAPHLPVVEADVLTGDTRRGKAGEQGAHRQKPQSLRLQKEGEAPAAPSPRRLIFPSGTPRQQRHSHPAVGQPQPQPQARLRSNRGQPTQRPLRPSRRTVGRVLPLRLVLLLALRLCSRRRLAPLCRLRGLLLLRPSLPLPGNSNMRPVPQQWRSQTRKNVKWTRMSLHWPWLFGCH